MNLAWIGDQTWFWLLLPGATLSFQSHTGDHWQFMVDGIVVGEYTARADAPHYDINSGGCG